MIEELEQLLEEAMAWAGVLSDEWTNMNPSDPGVTILETLTALHLVQKEAAGQVTDEARLGLLKLAGFTRQEAENTVLSVELAEPEEPVSFPAHQKFYVDNVCFETEEEVTDMHGCLSGVYVREQEGYREIKELKKGVPLNARPFGSRPEAGSTVYFLFRGIPGGTEPQMRLYVQVKRSEKRNPFSEEEPVRFCRMQWSVYVRGGFEDITFRDETHGFLQSGEISLQLAGKEPEKERIGSREGYLFCCRILDADYDRAPEIEAVYGPLFTLVQRDTWSFSRKFGGDADIRLPNVFAEEMFLSVYVRESGTDHYIKCEEAKRADGSLHRTGREERIVVCCNRHMMLHRELGILEGYDDQYLDCPPGGRADDKVICLGVRAKDSKGGEIYYFFRPGIRKENGVYYTYDESRGQICVHDAGPYRGCQAFLSDYAVSVWDAGNIRSGNTLVSVGGNAGICVRNPVRGKEGREKESFQSMRRRFLEDIRTPAAAVTKEDYEQLVLQVPGLCICKVSAYYEEKKECVCVVIMPWTAEAFPRLSPLYRGHIGRYLEKRKLLTDKVIVKDPAYVKVDVYVTVTVRDRESFSQKQVRQEIEEELDDRRNMRKIGQAISFDSLSSRIRRCPGAGHILELKITPAGVPSRLIRPGADIPVPPDAACFPGEIVIREE